MEFVVALIFAGVVIAAGVAIERNQVRKLHDTWDAVAEELDLRFDPTNDFLAGKLDGVDLYIHIVVRGSGKNRRIFTVFSSAVADVVPPGIRMTRQGMLSEVGKFLGMQDIEVGYPSFDDRFIIKCHHEKETLEFFSKPHIRTALLRLAQKHQNLQISEGSVTFELSGRVSNIHTMRSGIRALVQCVRQLRELGIDEIEEAPPAKQLESEPTPSPVPPKPAPRKPREETLDEKWAVPETDEGDDDVVW